MNSEKNNFHILHLCSSSDYNGETAHIYSLCRSLQRLGHTVTLGYRSRKKGRLLELHPRLVEQYRIKSSFPLEMDKGLSLQANSKGLLTLRRFLSENPVQIVHTHRGLDHTLAAILSTLQNEWVTRPIRLVRTRHVVTPVKNHFINCWLYNRCDLLVATAEKIRQEMLDKFPGIEPKLHLFHGGVDTQSFSPDTAPAAIRQELNIPGGTFLVGCAGHLDPVKGYPDAIEAFIRLKREGVQAALLIAGKGQKEKLEDLRKLIAQGQAEDRVFLLGFRDDIAQLFAACDAGLISSIGSEGNSRSALEIMATGLPLVATRVGCLPDLVEPEKNGLLLEPNNPEAIQNAVRTLVENPGKCSQLGREGRNRVLEHYSEAAVAARMEDYYRKLLDF
jgi:glycosyltransferase involved in cell wall biosynthesis